MNIQVALNVSRLNLGGKSKSVEEELAHSGGGGGFLVDHRLDVAGDTVDHGDNLLNSALERIDVGGNGSGTVLSVLGVGDRLETALIGLGVAELVGNGDESGAVGSALGGDTNGSGDISPGLEVLAGLSGDSQVDSGVRPCAIALAAVEVLDEGGEGVELGGSGVPANQNLAGVGLQVEGEHLLVIFHVDLDLVLSLGVADGEGGSDLNLASILGSCSQQSTDDALLIGIAAERVVENGENGLERHELYPSDHRTPVHTWG